MLYIWSYFQTIGKPDYSGNYSVTGKWSHQVNTLKSMVTIGDPTEPYGTIEDHTGPYETVRTIQDHIRPHQTKPDHM